MTDIEQAARAEAERRYPNNTHTRSTPFYAAMKREAFEAAASWLAEYLLSDENVEKAARAIHEVVEAGTPWEDTTAIQRTDRRVEARAALQAVLGKEQP